MKFSIKECIHEDDSKTYYAQVRKYGVWWNINWNYKILPDYTIK